MGSVSTKPILATSEPLVPLKLKTQPIANSPRMVSSPDFFHFYIECKDLTMNNIDVISPVCNGVFCDGQRKGDCLCGLLTAEVQSQELHNPAQIRNEKLIEIIASKCRTAEPEKRSFDVLDLSDCVDKCVTRINSENGWALNGWVKPTDSAIEATNYQIELHIVNIVPKNPVEITTGA